MGAKRSAQHDTETLMLTTLAKHADDSGRCSTSQAELAREAGVTRETVNRVIGRLVANGQLVRARRWDQAGRELTCEYRVTEKNRASPADDHTGVTSHGCDPDHMGVIEAQSPRCDHRGVVTPLKKEDPDQEILQNKNSLPVSNLVAAELEKNLQLDGGPSLVLQLQQSIQIQQQKQAWPEADLDLRVVIERQKAFNGSHLPRLMRYEFWDQLSELTNGLSPEFVGQEFVRMRMWFDENPGRRPTPRGCLRFVRTWFERAAERRRRSVPTAVQLRRVQ